MDVGDGVARQEEKKRNTLEKMCRCCEGGQG